MLPEAHVKFFVSDQQGVPEFSLSFPGQMMIMGVTAFAAVIMVATMVLLLDMLKNRRHRHLMVALDEKLYILSQLRIFAPVILRAGLGVTLILAGLSGYQLSPDPDHTIGAGIITLEIGLGIWLLSGIWTRLAACMVLGMMMWFALHGSSLAMLERLDIAAAGVFLLVMGGRRQSLHLSARQQIHLGWSLFAVRVMVASAVIAAAYSEKILHPELTAGLLVDTIPLPDSVLAAFPMIEISILLGMVELMIGLLLLIPRLPGLVFIMVAFPFIATMLQFGVVELIGHLPVYAVFATLILYGSHPGTRMLMEGFLPRFIRSTHPPRLPELDPSHDPRLLVIPRPARQYPQSIPADHRSAGQKTIA